MNDPCHPLSIPTVESKDWAAPATSQGAGFLSFHDWKRYNAGPPAWREATGRAARKGGFLLWMDEIHFAPPQTPWFRMIPLRKYQQTFWFQPWKPQVARFMDFATLSISRTHPGSIPTSPGSFEYTMGSGALGAETKALEKALTSMKRGEACTLTCSKAGVAIPFSLNQYGCGSKNRDQNGLPW